MLLSLLFWSSIIFCKHDITQFCLETAAGCCSFRQSLEKKEGKFSVKLYNLRIRWKVDYIFELKTVSTYVVIGEMFSFNQSQVNFDYDFFYCFDFEIIIDNF